MLAASLDARFAQHRHISDGYFNIKSIGDSEHDAKISILLIISKHHMIAIDEILLKN